MKLEEYLPRFRKPLIAFSGGSDSTYLFMKVRELCRDYVCVSLIMPNSPQRDMDRINEFSGKIIKTEYNPLIIPEFAENTEDRCYFCKKNMFSILNRIKEAEGCDCIFDGTNGSDQGSYRPGRRAGEEAGVLSPLLICGITKDMIRKETENLFPPVSDSCYATRIPYSDRITPEKIDIIKKA
ncbi:MAG: TIGR00268 family protein, partial [Armatimonadetes bacterium]|nr:TIGR00268 family protein [Candidatus Hippobium faecium]